MAEKVTAAQYGSIENGTPEKTPLTSTDGRPVLYNCRANFTLLDGGSRPLFEEYLEMCEFIVAGIFEFEFQFRSVFHIVFHFVYTTCPRRNLSVWCNR